MTRKIIQQQLYWCTASDHEFDWFVQAFSEKAARQFFNEYGDYEGKESRIKYVCEISIGLCESKSCWCPVETLKELGFEILQEITPVTIRRDGVIYSEGTWEKALLSGWDFYQQPLLYIVYLRSTTRFKIGYSAQFANRLNQIQSLNPYIVDILTLIPHPLARRWEGELKKKFAKYRINNEWFDFDEEGFRMLKKELDHYGELSLK